jgi:hypothetical protein
VLKCRPVHAERYSGHSVPDQPPWQSIGRPGDCCAAIMERRSVTVEQRWHTVGAYQDVLVLRHLPEQVRNVGRIAATWHLQERGSQRGRRLWILHDLPLSGSYHLL